MRKKFGLTETGPLNLYRIEGVHKYKGTGQGEESLSVAGSGSDLIEWVDREYHKPVRVTVNPLIWCDTDFHKVKRYVLGTGLSFHALVRIRVESLQASLQIPCSREVANRNVNNDSGLAIAMGSLGHNVSSEGAMG